MKIDYIKKRNFTSLLAILSFLVLSISGFLSYFLTYSRTLATIHTIFGLVFCVVIIFHISNNWKSIWSYIVDNNDRS